MMLPGGTFKRALTICVLASMLVAGSAGAAQLAGPRLVVAKVNLHPWRTTLVSVSPDGSRLVRLAGGEEDPLDSILISSLAWSPEGEEVAFTSINTIYRVKADGGEVRPLNLADAEDPVYAPDGQTIAFSRGDESEAAIWTVDRASGAQRRLTPSRRDLRYVPSSFSPDSSTLLATRIDRRTDEVEPVSVDLETGKVARLFGDGRGPVYSPDGTEVAFFREVGKRGNEDLFVLDVASGKLQRLTRTPHKVELFASLGPVGRAHRLLSLSRGTLRMGQRDHPDQRRRNLREGGRLEKRTVFWGAAWQPGPGRGAGPIGC